MFSDLMTQEGYTYDFVYDWLMKKSERTKIRKALKADDEEEKEPKRMTKAEKFRLTQEKFGDKDNEEEKKIEKVSSSKKVDESNPKDSRVKSFLKTKKKFNAKGEVKKEEKKKNDIYAAMKDAGFGAAKPKIVTNNVRNYRY